MVNWKDKRKLDLMIDFFIRPIPEHHHHLRKTKANTKQSKFSKKDSGKLNRICVVDIPVSSVFG